MFGLSLSSDFVVLVVCSAINKYDYFEGVFPSTALFPPNASSPAQSSSFSSLFPVFVAQPTSLAGAPPLPRPRPRRHPLLWPWHPRVAPVLRGHLCNPNAPVAAAFLSSPPRSGQPWRYGTLVTWADVFKELRPWNSLHCIDADLINTHKCYNMRIATISHRRTLGGDRSDRPNQPVRPVGSRSTRRPRTSNSGGTH